MSNLSFKVSSIFLLVNIDFYNIPVYYGYKLIIILCVTGLYYSVCSRCILYVSY